MARTICRAFQADDVLVLRAVKTHRMPVVLLAICVLGLALRTLGITYGLPAIYNPDETPIVVLVNRNSASASTARPAASR